MIENSSDGNSSSESASLAKRTHRPRRLSELPRPSFPEVSIRAGDFFSGLPALVVLVLAVSSLAWARFAPESRIRAYEKQADARVYARDYPGAVICYKRLVSFHAGQPKQPGTLFKMAYALDLADDRGRAEGIMRSIAPETTGKPVFPLADQWLGEKLMEDRSTDKKSAELHLLRFLELAPTIAPSDTPAVQRSLIRSKALLGIYYAQTGRYREARPYLEATANKDRADLLLTLSLVCKELGDELESRRAAEEAKKAFQAYSDRHPRDANGPIYLSRAHELLGDYERAIEVIRPVANMMGKIGWRKNVGRIHAAWAVSLARQGKDQDSTRFSVLEEGLKYEPENRVLLEQLNVLLVTDEDRAEKARAVLRSLLSSGKAMAIAHFALGSDAWRNGRTEEAREHWEQACKLEPATLEIANNLAYSLAHDEPTDLPRALSLILQALATAKGDSAWLLHGTHGQILLEMKRYKEAVSELELALKGPEKEKRGIHKALARAYAKVGLEDMAAEHRKLEK